MNTPNLSNWATDMAEADLTPYDGQITLAGDDKPFVRLHFAFTADMDDDVREAFLTKVGQIVLRAL